MKSVLNPMDVPELYESNKNGSKEQTPALLNRSRHYLQAIWCNWQNPAYFKIFQSSVISNRPKRGCRNLCTEQGERIIGQESSNFESNFEIRAQAEALFGLEEREDGLGDVPNGNKSV